MVHWKATMDRSIAVINNTNLCWYEHDVIQKQKKSNRYTAFLHCACKEYYFTNNAHKHQIINQVMGVDMYPRKITYSDLIRQWLVKNPANLKHAWKLCANLIGSFPRIGHFRVLPEDTPEYKDTKICVCITQECDLLTDMMWVLSKKESNSMKTQNTKFYLPHPVVVGHKIYA